MAMHLLGLPTELRLLIFEQLILSQDEKDEIHIANGKPSLLTSGYNGNHIEPSRPKSWSLLPAHPTIFKEAQRLVLDTHPICFQYPTDISSLMGSWFPGLGNGKRSRKWSGQIGLDLKDGALVAEAIVALKGVEDLTRLNIHVHGIQHEYHNALYVILANSCPVSGFASLSNVQFAESKVYLLEGATETTFWKSLDDIEQTVENLHKILANPADLEENVANGLRIVRHFWHMGSILGGQKFWRLGFSSWIEEMNSESAKMMGELKRRKMIQAALAG